MKAFMEQRSPFQDFLSASPFRQREIVSHLSRWRFLRHRREYLCISLSVCLSIPLWKSLSHSQVGAMREEGWQAHSEHTGTGDTTLVSHLGVPKPWWNTWRFTTASLGADSASQGAFRLRAPFKDPKLKQSKLHVDVGFWITPCLEYQQGSGLCDLHCGVFVFWKWEVCKEGREVSQRKARITTVNREGAYLWSLPSL